MLRGNGHFFPFLYKFEMDHRSGGRYRDHPKADKSPTYGIGERVRFDPLAVQHHRNPRSTYVLLRRLQFQDDF
jgi:hypothetical protein